MDLDEPVTLYNPLDGGQVITSTRAEVVRLRAAGYTEDPPFDPTEHKVEEVQAHLAEHPEDAPRVVAAEKTGRRRSTIVGSESTAGSDGDAGHTGTTE
jgi:hypothetical protein